MRGVSLLQALSINMTASHATLTSKQKLNHVGNNIVNQTHSNHSVSTIDRGCVSPKQPKQNPSYFVVPLATLLLLQQVHFMTTPPNHTTHPWPCITTKPNTKTQHNDHKLLVSAPTAILAIPRLQTNACRELQLARLSYQTQRQDPHAAYLRYVTSSDQRQFELEDAEARLSHQCLNQ
jgi:hypothetical protein